MVQRGNVSRRERAGYISGLQSTEAQEEASFNPIPYVKMGMFCLEGYQIHPQAPLSVCSDAFNDLKRKLNYQVKKKKELSDQSL